MWGLESNFGRFMGTRSVVQTLATLAWDGRRGPFFTAELLDALQILDQDSEKPLFLWVHFIDLHTPFQAQPDELDLEAWNAEVHQSQPQVAEDGTVVGEVFAGTSNVRGGMLWLEPKDRQTIVEYYDKAGVHLKSFDSTDWKLQHGRFWRAFRSEMKNLQTGKRTDLIFDKVFLNLSLYTSKKTGKKRDNLTDEAFTTRALEGR